MALAEYATKIKKTTREQAIPPKVPAARRRLTRQKKKRVPEDNEDAEDVPEENEETEEAVVDSNGFSDADGVKR